MIQPMPERIQTRSRYLWICRKVPRAIETESLFGSCRRRMAALSLAVRCKVLEGIDAGIGDVGIGGEIPGAVEAKSLFR
jgi:hypothetical protein